MLPGGSTAPCHHGSLPPQPHWEHYVSGSTTVLVTCHCSCYCTVYTSASPGIFGAFSQV